MRTVEIEGKVWDVVEVSNKYYGRFRVLCLFVLWLKIVWRYRRNLKTTYLIKPVYTVDTVGVAIKKEEA